MTFSAIEGGGSPTKFYFQALDGTTKDGLAIKASIECGPVDRR